MGTLTSQLLTEPRRPVWVRTSALAPWLVVGTVCIGAFMGQLDASIVTLALPRLGHDLNANVGAVEWVALAYLLVVVATVATIGRIADAVGRKLLYVYGFAVFTAGSLLCGLAPTLGVLIGARVLQAVGAAMLQANSIALITEAVPRAKLGRALGIQGTFQALGLALGPAIGGALMALAGWRLIFLVNLPAGLLGLTFGWFLLPRSRSRRQIVKPDRGGAVLLALGAAGPLAYLSLGLHAGWGEPALLVLLALGCAAAVAFVRRERSFEAPLIDLALLRRPLLSIGLASSFVSYVALFGTLFVVPYFLAAEHVGSARIGLELCALPAAIAVAAPVAGRLLGRVGHRPLTIAGLLLVAVGLLAVAAAHGGAGTLPGLVVAGLGFGAFTPANNATIMGGAPAGHAGVVSGVLNMTRGLGTATGVALASALYVAGRAGSPSAGLHLALGVLGLLTLTTAAAVGFASWRTAPTTSTTTPVTSES